MRFLAILIPLVCVAFVAAGAGETAFVMDEASYHLPNGCIEFRSSAEGWRPLIWTARHVDGRVTAGDAVAGSFTLNGTNVNLLQPATEKQVLRELCRDEVEQHPKHGEVRHRRAPAITVAWKNLSAARQGEPDRKKGTAYAGTVDLVVTLDGKAVELRGAAVTARLGRTRRKVNKKRVEVPRISLHATATCKAKDLGLAEEPEAQITLDVYDTAFGTPKG